MLVPKNSFLVILLASSSLPMNAVHSASIDFRVEDSKPASNLKDLNFQSRITLPYGPALYDNLDGGEVDDSQPYKGYGPGMGAAEQIVFDPVQKFVYSMSDAGYIIVVDYENPRTPILTKFSFPTRSDDLGSIELCADMLFLSLQDQGQVDVYNTIQRSSPSTPQLLQTLEAGPNAKFVLANRNCTLLAVSNTNKGEQLAQGSITIIQDFTTSNSRTTTIPMDFNDWDDTYLLRRGLNMPLTKNALKYWDEFSADAEDLDFADVIADYRPSIFLEPEYLAWNGPEETELLVNLQENNGLLRINMTDFTAIAVVGYGLKDFGEIPIDVNENDKACNLKTHPSLFGMRNPDTIATVKYGEKYYVVTANEGGGKEYGDWEEETKGKKLFKGSEFALNNVHVDPRIFSPNPNITTDSTLFNKECDGGDCLQDVELSLGSNSIDFESDFTNPIFYRMVLFGGRGWSIYELPQQDPEEELLKLVYDSADAIERRGCQQFPWAHNAKIDEEFAPIQGPNSTFFNYLTVQGDSKTMEDMVEKNDPEEKGCLDQGDGTPGACPLSQTIDNESNKDGPAVENIMVGVACGRLLTAMATEKSSIALVFDITEVNAPSLFKVFHLSLASQNLSMGLAYNQGVLGEIDPESGAFLSAEESPSGKAGLLWSGAYSGTISWWEFECEDDHENNPDMAQQELSSSSSSLLTTRMFVGCMLLLSGTMTILA